MSTETDADWNYGTCQDKEASSEQKPELCFRAWPTPAPITPTSPSSPHSMTARHLLVPSHCGTLAGRAHAGLFLTKISFPGPSWSLGVVSCCRQCMHGPNVPILEQCSPDDAILVFRGQGRRPQRTAADVAECLFLGVAARCVCQGVPGDGVLCCDLYICCCKLGQLPL